MKVGEKKEMLAKQDAWSLLPTQQLPSFYLCSAACRFHIPASTVVTFFLRRQSYPAGNSVSINS